MTQPGSNAPDYLYAEYQALEDSVSPHDELDDLLDHLKDAERLTGQLVSRIHEWQSSITQLLGTTDYFSRIVQQEGTRQSPDVQQFHTQEYKRTLQESFGGA